MGKDSSAGCVGDRAVGGSLLFSWNKVGQTVTSVLTLLTKRVRAKFLPAASNLGERRGKRKRRKKTKELRSLIIQCFSIIFNADYSGELDYLGERSGKRRGERKAKELRSFIIQCFNIIFNADYSGEVDYLGEIRGKRKRRNKNKRVAVVDYSNTHLLTIMLQHTRLDV